MTQRYRKFKRGWGVYHVYDNQTGLSKSLETRNRQDAERLVHAMNEAELVPLLNRQIARAYLMAADPLAMTRTWEYVMEEKVKTVGGATRDRWLTGASQTDAALMEASNVDRVGKILSYYRRKTKEYVQLEMGPELEEILAALPASGPFFPYLRRVRANDRATEFRQRCDGLGIPDVTLHCYRYTWAQRAKA